MFQPLVRTTTARCTSTAGKNTWCALLLVCTWASAVPVAVCGIVVCPNQHHASQRPRSRAIDPRKHVVQPQRARHSIKYLAGHEGGASCGLGAHLLHELGGDFALPSSAHGVT